MCLTHIFCQIDDFCREFENKIDSMLLSSGKTIVKRNRKKNLSKSEVMTIIVFFHLSGFRTFKYYYNNYVKTTLNSAFGNRLVSYNRFVELMQECTLHLFFYMNKERLSKSTGISFIDSTSIKICNNLRIHTNKVFKTIGARGKTSTGWFYGFKLHITINHNGEITAFYITPGNVADNNLKIVENLTKNIHGKIFGDKGYISKKLFHMLLKRGITLVTKIRKNMENKIMSLFDKLLLYKRGIIESVINKLKNTCQIEHTRHRSPINFLGNVISGLIAYTFLDKKPSIKLPERFFIENS